MQGICVTVYVYVSVLTRGVRVRAYDFMTKMSVQAFVPIKNSDRRAFARGAPAHHIHASLERIGMYVRTAVA